MASSSKTRPKPVLKSNLLDAIGIEITEAGKSDCICYVDKYDGKSSDHLKYFIPDPELFVEMGKAKRGDWLAEHKESGQTYRKYTTAGHRLCPDRRHNTIFLLPLTFDEDPVPPEVLEPLRDFAETFFGMPVKLEKVKNLKGRVTDRLNYGVYQAHAGNVLDVMSDHIPSGAFCTAGITMCDLYPRESWNFVFGLAKLSGRCGVYSLARYLSNFGDSRTTKIDLHKDSIPTILVRACKTMCHEIGHMFGLKHCIYYQCLMNGSNHLDESDSRPNVLCPVCLRKLHSACKFDIEARYQQMLQFWSEQKLDDQVEWLQTRLLKLQERPSHS